MKTKAFSGVGYKIKQILPSASVEELSHKKETFVKVKF